MSQRMCWNSSVQKKRIELGRRRLNYWPIGENLCCLVESEGHGCADGAHVELGRLAVAQGWRP